MTQGQFYRIEVSLQIFPTKRYTNVPFNSLTKKIIGFIQFEMFMALALKTPKTVRIYMVKT